MLDSGALSFDQGQNLVVEKLQLLTNRLAHYIPPSQAGFLSTLFGQQSDPLKGLYIFGGVGSGKTMLMDLFYNALSLEKKQRKHFSHFMEDVHSAIKSSRDRHDADPVITVAEQISDRTTLLCLDEFQVTDITDAMILARLFEALFQRGLVLVTTGNIAPQNLYQNGINRALFLPFIDLLEDHTDIIALESAHDYRRMAVETGIVWFNQQDKDARERYQFQWQRMTAGFTPQPHKMTIHDRKLTIPLAAGKIARFSFSDLCVQPLGRSDYLAIAQNYSTLFIDDIPVMGQDMRNEARRFTLLIDSLYDEGCILIALADSTADQLLGQQSRTHTEEFQRTISRLIEMRSTHYISRHTRNEFRN